MYGLNVTEITELIKAVTTESDGDLTTAETLDRFARAVWSGVAEPGDTMAGILIEEFGAAEALSIIHEKQAATEILELLSDGGYDMAPSELEAGLARFQPRLNFGTAIVALRQAARFGAKLLAPDSMLWPKGISDLGHSAPNALWFRGNEAAVAALSNSIGIVGARAATGYGEHVTMEMSAGMVDRGITVVSGAAYGIDGMAHRAALASHGMTVAILAGGVDRFYPSGHDALLARIVENGAVIGELPCGSQPTRWRFLQRNRIIAAASQATLVVEAGWRSGSLNTARHATELRRPVGAVPGPITSAASAGCHRIIAEGQARIITTSDEAASMLPAEVTE